MPTLPFAQIDAFADRPFAGNPAAVVPLDTWLDDAVLQAIAAENNLSETAFFVPDSSGQTDFELRWFTPAVEVKLCGHATLASGHYLLSADGARERVTFRTRQSGMLEVARDGEGYSMALPAYPPAPAEMPGLLAALGVEGETLRHPRGYDLTVVENATIVRGLAPDFAALAALGDTLNIVTAPGDGGVDVVSRVFAPAVGLDEDPVTGSAHAVLAPYWAKRLGRERFSAFQASARGGRVECRIEDERVVLGGTCVTVIEGRLFL
ncbi:PhzF family phenazine biosynthesis protein [Sphingomonas xinjiangensis]|uniref:PhzF family phenazine biosynthesis protein n=1 Tax=Sphingomonas xinjiangensis TaxID=643568 RepID=A0A840YJT1_9SPHN|nr:PhzF family phenazine biosynthesis protein [Sphingomonas xinjiangensis]MBB5711298.1 PhzF family phenazine biosynthesis protein [Sphingomonas xinjiangensis]